MDFKGTVVFKGQPETITDKLTKQVVVVQELGDAKYPATIAVDFINDKVDMIKDIVPGDVVDLQLNFKANESKTQAGRYFNSISCRRLTKDSHMTENVEQDAPF